MVPALPRLAAARGPGAHSGSLRLLPDVGRAAARRRPRRQTVHTVASRRLRVAAAWARPSRGRAARAAEGVAS
eukprot:9502828-Pyramimonas_sp.AAC.1